ncbi:MAG: polysaccharide pyruvyl transferase family protein [Pseudomonadota bacterium]
MGKPFTICLIGHSSNSDNLGVGALTVAEVAILREIAADLGLDLKIRLIDWKDTRTPYVTGDDIEIKRIGLKEIANPTQLFASYRGADLMIDIGAGDSFADIYGPKRLTMMLAMKYQAHLAGLPVVLAPQTIGPFKSAWARRAALPHLNRARLVFTRDALSTQALRDMGYKGEIGEASDIALRLPFERTERSGDGSVRVGLNVSGLLMNGGYSGKNMFGLKADYPALIDGILSDFKARANVAVTLVPHVISPSMPVEDDYAASEALAAKHPGVDVAPRFASPSEAKSFISGFDFFMGARMHATIAAFSAGVPVVPMAYSRKFRGMFGSMGYERTVEATSESAEAIRGKIAEAFETREAVGAEVAAALATGQGRVERYVTALRALIAELSGAPIATGPAADPAPAVQS